MDNRLSVANLHTLVRGTVRRIWGPPGCGKTTTLARATLATVRERGPESTMIVSFTTTAAAAIADAVNEAALRSGTGIAIPSRNIGTLHSLGFRAIGTPDVALDPKKITGWNDTCPADWRIRPDGRRSTPDMAAETGMLGGAEALEDVRSGDALLGQMELLRATLTPEEDWPVRVRSFAQRWDDWKRDAGVADFGDMILGALDRALDGEPAPGRPEVFIVDETQDLTPAELALAFLWGGHASQLVLAFDDDQSINAWRGADAAPLLRLGTDENGQPRDDVEIVDRVLEQSYRIPSSVHAVAERWVHRIPPTQRHEKVYHPRTEVGHCYTAGLSLEDPRLISHVRADIEAGRSVMIIASCGYMLTPVLNGLRKAGIPFANRYRPAEPRWNPLRRPAKGMGFAERVYRYLIVDPTLPNRVLHDQRGQPAGSEQRWRFWTGDDIRAWLPLVRTFAEDKVRILANGAKKKAETLPDGPVPWPLIADLFSDVDALEWATGGRTDPATGKPLGRPDIEFLAANAINAETRKKLEYPAQVVRNFGTAALDDEPLVTIGTIHSVKGGGADVVYLAPDLSTAGASQWFSTDEGERDQIIRLFYVGLTRAKQRVVVLNQAGQHGVPRRMLVPVELEVRDVPEVARVSA